MPKLFTLRFLSWRYLVLAWAMCLAVWFISYDSQWASLTTSVKTPLNKSKLISLFTHFHHRNQALATISTRLAVYDELYSQINIYDFLKKHSLQERCMAYFNHLAMSDPEWLINPDESTSFDRAAFQDFETFKNKKQQKWEDEAKEAEKEGKDAPPRHTEASLRKDYDTLRKTVLSHEQTLHDFVAHVRIFDKCFMNGHDSVTRRNDTRFVKKQQQFLKQNVDYEYTVDERNSVGKAYSNKLECDEVETKIFPFLTNQYPEFVRWNGEKSFFPGSDNENPATRGCFLNDFKRRVNGRGIVMTLGDGHIEDAARLIRVLRFFRNKYPIQVVYHNNLSPDSRYNLIRAARNDFRDLPQQDIWFVNAEKSIQEKYLSKFGGFANKIMAIMFNSFEEMFFLDADSVILKDVDYFFNLKKYVKAGTMFYKDRSTFEFRAQEDNVFFKKLLPSVDDSMVFNIPQTSNYTLQNEFFNSTFVHYMESGAVVLNRKKHFMTPFMMAIMNFYNLIVTRVYGDKEMFWLSCAFLGDENYAFNNNFAASIGELTPESERHKDINSVKSFHSKEICSNHPSHISDEDDSLVWLNSGFRFCGNAFRKTLDYQKEFEKGKRFTKIKTLEEFKTFFLSKLKISHAIIPPFYIDHSRATNVEHEPETPWVMAHYCDGYCWCAYSLIGGYYKDGEGNSKTNRLEGRVIEFPEKDQKLFDTVADVWIAPLGWT